MFCGKKQIVLRIAVCSYESYSGRVTKWKPDKFSQETGFESMTSVILVKWMLHKTKIHNWSELVIPGLYLKFVIIVHQHWAFSLVGWMKRISVLFPRLVLFQRFLFEHPLWALWMGIWAIHLKKNGSERERVGGGRKFQRAKERFLQWKIVNNSNQHTHQGISVSNTFLNVWGLEPNQCSHYGQHNTLRNKCKDNERRPIIIDLKGNTKLSNL